jgi:hypothetical protein
MDAYGKHETSKSVDTGGNGFKEIIPATVSYIDQLSPLAVNIAKLSIIFQ